MSTTTETEPEVEVTKTVTIMAYLRRDLTPTAREWADARDDDTDYFETKVREDTKRYLVTPADKHRIFDDEEWKSLKASNLGDIKLEEDITREDVHVHSPNDEAKKVLRECLGDNPELPDGFEWNNFWRRVQDEDGTDALLTYSYAGEYGLVKHPSKMDGTEDDPWEDEEEEYPAMKFKMNIKNVNEDECHALNEAITETLINRLRTRNDVERVRWVDCEMQKTEKGACYNI